MKYLVKIMFAVCIASFVVACEDPNDAFDMHSPQATIPVDTFEVHRGEAVTLNATLSDESGLWSYKLEYAKWKVVQEVLLHEEGSPATYQFTADIIVPDDALFEWEEDYQKHDGSTFKVKQTYHKLSLIFYDAVKNKNVKYFYIKVLP